MQSFLLKLSAILLFMGSTHLAMAQCNSTGMNPANDDPDQVTLGSAFDITALLTSGQLNRADNKCGWECEATARTYLDPGTTEPTVTTIATEGTEMCDDANPREDVWFIFDYNGEDVWLDFYGDGTNSEDLIVAIYQETGVVGVDGACAVTGLTYVGCSDGGAGDATDVAGCTTPVHERLDLNTLPANGTYYARVWSFNGNDGALSQFHICAEQTAPVQPAIDFCPFLIDPLPTPTIGCDGVLVPVGAGDNVNQLIPNQSNAGATGNSTPGLCDDRNGVVATGGPVVGSECGGGATIGVPIGVNTVRNNNVFYSFEVGVGSCVPQVSLQFDNIVVCCGETNTIQIEVFTTGVTGCLTPTSVVADAFDPTPGMDCIEYNIPTNVGTTYGISVEGLDGALVKYDLTIVVDYTNGSGASCNTAVDCDPVVAAELTNFDAVATDKTNLLTWTTASEIDNDHFEVERATDGKTFEMIGNVGGAGTSVNVQAYDFIDEKPALTSYYRLKMVETDGTYDYSETVVVQRTIKGDINVYPVPANDELTIELNDWQATAVEDVMIEIVDVLGSIKLQQNAPIADEVTLNVSTLTAGIYHVIVRDGISQTMKRIIIE